MSRCISSEIAEQTESAGAMHFTADHPAWTQEQEHQQELQVERARLALLQLEANYQDEAHPHTVRCQSIKKKRRLNTSQKRLVKVMLDSQPIMLLSHLLPS